MAHGRNAGCHSASHGRQCGRNPGPDREEPRAIPSSLAVTVTTGMIVTRRRAVRLRAGPGPFPALGASDSGSESGPGTGGAAVMVPVTVPEPGM